MASTDTPAFVRLIQTSSFAKLPIEILSEIEKKLKEYFEDAFERQEERLKFGTLSLSTKGASSGWMELTVWEERMGELIKILEEIGAGDLIQSIRIIAQEVEIFEAVLTSVSVEFGQLMRMCRKLKKLYLEDCNLTRDEVGSLGVTALVENCVELTRLSLTNPTFLIRIDCFFPLFAPDNPAHLLLGESISPQSPFLTHFISVELVENEVINASDLNLLLGQSVGYLNKLSIGKLLVKDDEEEKHTAEDLFKGLGDTLTDLRIGGTGRSNQEEDSGLIDGSSSIIPFLQTLQQLTLQADSFDPNIFQVLSKFSHLEEVSIVCGKATKSNGSAWQLLEFIKKPPLKLRTVRIFPSTSPEDDCNYQVISRLRELRVAATAAKVTLKFPLD